MLPFYMPNELRNMHFKSIGKNIAIKRNVCFYHPEHITIGNNVRIDDFCVLSAEGASGEINIGNFVHINSFSALYGKYKITMEDFCGLSSHVILFTESDDYSGRSLTNPTVPEKFKPGLEKGGILLRRHVIAGAGTVVLPNVIIGEGAAIGAFSLVKYDVDAWSVYVGCPARKKGVRKKDLLELETQFLSKTK